MNEFSCAEAFHHCLIISEKRNQMPQSAVLLRHGPSFQFLHQFITCCLHPFPCLEREFFVFDRAKAVIEYILLSRNGNDAQRYHGHLLLAQLSSSITAHCVLPSSSQAAPEVECIPHGSEILKSPSPATSCAAFPIQIAAWGNESRRNRRCVCAIYPQTTRHH